MPEAECKIYKALTPGHGAVKPHRISHPGNRLMLQHRSDRVCCLFSLDLGCRNKTSPLCPERRQSWGTIKLQEVSDGEGGRLSKEVCGGTVKLQQSKYVISRRDQDTDWTHMSQQRVRERNLLKCGQIELQR